MSKTPLSLHPHPERAAEMAANAVMVYLDKAEITDRTERRKWITKVFELVTAKEDKKK